MFLSPPALQFFQLCHFSSPEADGGDRAPLGNVGLNHPWDVGIFPSKMVIFHSYVSLPEGMIQQ